MEVSKDEPTNRKYGWFTVVGIRIRTHPKSNEIPQLWQQQGERLGEVQHVAEPNVAYGIAHSIFIEAFLPVNGKSLLEVSGLDVDHERRLIDNNGGYWPSPTLEELKGQPHLSDKLIRFLASKHEDHPGKTVTDQAILTVPLTMLDATFISEDGWLRSSREADLIETLQNHGNWDFKTIEGGHWPMLTIPDELSTLLHGVRT